MGFFAPSKGKIILFIVLWLTLPIAAEYHPTCIAEAGVECGPETVIAAFGVPLTIVEFIGTVAWGMVPLSVLVQEIIIFAGILAIYAVIAYFLACIIHFGYRRLKKQKH